MKRNQMRHRQQFKLSNYVWNTTSNSGLTERKGLTVSITVWSINVHISSHLLTGLPAIFLPNLFEFKESRDLCPQAKLKILQIVNIFNIFMHDFSFMKKPWPQYYF